MHNIKLFLIVFRVNESYESFEIHICLHHLEALRRSTENILTSMVQNDSFMIKQLILVSKKEID